MSVWNRVVYLHTQNNCSHKKLNKMKLSSDYISFGKPLQNDNIYPTVKVVDFAEVTGLESRAGIDKLILVDDVVQKVASNDYGLLPNENFFGEFENKLDEAGINYITRSVNRRNRNFAVDYILDDSNLHTNVKGNNKDRIRPFMRAQTSYDGSLQTEGWFGFFREICSNGLHITEKSQIKFKLRHRGNLVEIVMPHIEELIAYFMDNEYFSLHKKFEVLAEKSLKTDAELENFVKFVAGKTSLFKYEKSEKNPEEPSQRAQLIIDTVHAEAKSLGVTPNLWLGYNAFNEYIHTNTNKDFRLQANADKSLFETVMHLVN